VLCCKLLNMYLQFFWLIVFFVIHPIISPNSSTFFLCFVCLEIRQFCDIRSHCSVIYFADVKALQFRISPVLRFLRVRIYEVFVSL